MSKSVHLGLKTVHMHVIHLMYDDCNNAGRARAGRRARTLQERLTRGDERNAAFEPAGAFPPVIFHPLTDVLTADQWRVLSPRPAAVRNTCRCGADTNSEGRSFSQRMLVQEVCGSLVRGPDCLRSELGEQREM
ncbi:hypothetical protein AMELA_G00061390 [Ameiurus melas]|uniref:Uncharacterized protein n=1 Tax=Ameiurus melas TaxID=219545 RepID=A0A7J6B4I9_AMEME|nr:hypothetical protein AMELA_G00061390 [Ameiurus melas]